MLSENEILTLIESARGAREKAYAPYSRFSAGAALLAASGAVYLGCNVENASFGATICAERAAICAAVAAGERVFTAIAVTAGGDPVTPCGICRQVMEEFSRDGGFAVICDVSTGRSVCNSEALMPETFTKFEPEEKQSV